MTLEDAVVCTVVLLGAFVFGHIGCSPIVVVTDVFFGAFVLGHIGCSPMVVVAFVVSVVVSSAVVTVVTVVSADAVSVNDSVHVSV